MSSIWITWEYQRRNRSMAARLGATLHELDYRGHFLARYWVLGWRTVGIVRRSRPDVVYYQNPSLVLAALVTTLKFFGLTHAKIVGDFHNAGVFPPVLRFLVPWIVRNSDLIVVSNKNLQPAIEGFGGRSVAIPDPIPEIHAHTRVESGSGEQFAVFFICSWASDEPIDNVLRAAQMIEATDRSITVAITGRPKLERIGWHAPVPGNVELTGYLADADFEARLAAASAVLDLTTRADCMVCGAYEAVSVGVPMIVSNNEPTRRYFHKGALYTDNSAEDIAKLILELRADYARFKHEIVELKQELLLADRAALQLLDELTASPASVGVSNAQ